MKEWVAASLRYFVTTLGVLLAALDILPQSSWDQIAPALVALLTAIYGVWRTRRQEQDLDTAETALVLFAFGAAR